MHMSSNPQKLSRNWQGFSLIELMVVIAVLSVVLGLAVPNLQQMVVDNRIKAAANTLHTALHMARNEAIARNTTVTLCPSAVNPKRRVLQCSGGNDYANGILIRTDSETLQTEEGISNGISITGQTEYVFRSGGTSREGNITVTHARSNIERTICVGSFGQIRVSEGRTCPNP